jgi:acyl transferase domain-containing protein
MDPILDELREVAASMRVSPARIPLVSNVTGEFMAGDIGGNYWSSHVRQAVLFYDGLKKIVDAGCTVLVEVGPQPTLTPAVATSFDTTKIQAVPTLIRDKNDLANILGTLASLYVNGVSPNLDRLFWSPFYRRVSLPLYPFRRDRHWLRGNGVLHNTQEERPALAKKLHPILGQAITIGPRRAIFQTSFSTTSPWTDHRVLGTTVFPGTAYLEMAARGFAAVNGEDWRPVTLKDVTFERPLILTYGKPKKVTLTLDLASNGSGEASFVIAAADGDSQSFCRGRLSTASVNVERISMEAELSRKDSEMAIGPFYGELRKGGMEYGAEFATVRELWLGAPDSGEAFGRIATSLLRPATDNPYTNAVLLDGCLQVFGAALRMGGASNYQGAYVPTSIQSATLRHELPSQMWSHVTVSMNGDGRAALAHIRVLNDEGKVLADIDGLELRQTNSLNPGNKNGAVVRTSGVSASVLGLKSRDELIQQLRGMPKHERVGELSRWLAAEVKDTMGQAAEGLDLDNIHPSTAFLEIGLDSLLVTELQRRIQEKLEFRFQPMQGLDYQSIESLAEFIHDEVLAGALATESSGSEQSALAV